MMSPKEEAKPPKPNMVWSDKLKMWVEQDTRSPERRAKDEAIARSVEADQERLMEILRQAEAVQAQQGEAVAKAGESVALRVLQELVAARKKVNLTQVEVARRMNLSQSAIVRLESGIHSPTLSTLSRYAAAIGAKLEVSGIPGHGSTRPNAGDMKQLAAEAEAAELLRKRLQGLGRPIISTEHLDRQFVAVGSRLHWGKWLTFVDFLSDYIKTSLGSDWGNAEIAKPLEKRHPIIQWYDHVCKQQRAAVQDSGKIHSMLMTGATAAYFGLAYNLYLLEHNAELKERLIQRLKNRDQFRGAYYECLVAACFALAGFELSLENEDANDTTHCEFSARSKVSGNWYSVEAKSRAPGKSNTDVGNQLYEALQKEAKYQRIVMVDVNMPDDRAKEQVSWIESTVSGIKGREPKLKVRGSPAPAAYVIVTNHPYHYDLTGTSSRCAVVGEGFKIQDFGYSARFPNLKEAFKSSQRHADVIALMETFVQYCIPSTMTGELPEFEFGAADRQFVIGRKYDLSAMGLGPSAELEDGCVLEPTREAYLVYSLLDGRRVVVRTMLTEPELIAYRSHPETFFGVARDTVRKPKDPLELFRFFYESYKSTPAPKLLEFMQGAPDISALSKLTHEELVLEFCERLAGREIQTRSSNKSA